MAVRFILMMALMMVALADPVPDPDIRVDVKQIVNARCGGGCCEDNCCVFDGDVWPNKAYLTITCLLFQCWYGQWEYIGINQENDCGECIADGDPHIHPFDPIEYQGGTIDKYRLTYKGDYVIAQDNLVPFGVNSKFVADGPDSGIESITYSEPGIAIKLKVDAIGKCVYPYTNDKCKLKAEKRLGRFGVFRSQTVSGSVATIYGGWNGPILLFEFKLPSLLSDGSPPFTPYENVNCIIIVGTQGFSVALCSVKDHYSFLYIWAMPRLKNVPTDIHGLCNTYTGGPVKNITLQDGQEDPADECLKTSTSPPGWYTDIKWDCAKTWCADGAKCTK